MVPEKKRKNLTGEQDKRSVPCFATGMCADTVTERVTDQAGKRKDALFVDFRISKKRRTKYSQLHVTEA